MNDLRRWMNVLCEAEVPPTMLYHSAPTSDRDSIRKEGLLRSKSHAHRQAMAIGFTPEEGPFGGIFFASKPTNQTAHGIDTWAVNVQGLHLQSDDTTDSDDAEDTWWVTYDEDVMPDRLTLLYGA
jgi:hypothetical protein